MRLTARASGCDALIAESNFIFDPGAPAPLRVLIEPRGAAFVSVKRCYEPSVNGNRPSCPLPDGSWSWDGSCLTLDESFLSTLSAGEYAVFSAKFSRGQPCVFSVYVKPEQRRECTPLVDFAELTDELLEFGYKSEYFASVSRSTEVCREGRASLRLDYDFALWPAGVNAFFETYRKCYIHCPRPTAVAMWLYGDGSRNTIELRLFNRSRTTVYPENTITLDWVGWKRVFFRLPQEPDLPLMLNELLRLRLGDGSLAPRGSLWLDSLEAVCSPTEPQGEPWLDLTNPSPPFSLCMTGGTLGLPARFSLSLGGGFVPSGEVKLICATESADALLFSDGAAETAAFTSGAYPAGSHIAFYAEDSAGTRTPAVWMTVSESERCFASLPARVRRFITSDPCRSAAFSAATDVFSPALGVCVTDGSGAEAGSVRVVSSRERETADIIALPTANVPDERELYAHKIYIDGLSPDSSYSCRFECGSEKYAFDFKTFPESDVFSAVILADAHCGHALRHDRLDRCLRAGLRRAPAPTIIITLGDMLNSAADFKAYGAMLAASQKLFRELPTAPSPGNHDRDIFRRYAAYAARTALPDCGVPGCGGLLWSASIGQCLFVSLTSDGYAPGSPELLWLERELASGGCRWKFVLLHESPYGGKSAREYGRRVLAPIFERCGVDAVLSAHDHIYARSSVLAGQRCPLGEGVLYLTLGTSGAEQYGSSRQPWQDFVYGCSYSERRVEDVPDLTTVAARFEPERVVFDVRMMSGRHVDTVVLEKPL